MELSLKKVKKTIAEKGYLKLKNISHLTSVKKLEEKVLNRLNKPLYINRPKRMSNNLYIAKAVKGPQINLPHYLHKKILNKGYGHYKNYTNSITFNQPLLNFKECHSLVFNEKVMKYASIILGKPAKLGFVALSCLMDNKLPKNDINYLHTDDISNSKVVEKNRLVKFTIPISTNAKYHNEYHHLPISKLKLKNKIKQYSDLNEIPKILKNKIVSPKIKNVDGMFFDPDNFFHLAAKPKKKIRIILYVVYIKEGNYLVKKAKNLKIKKKEFLKLPNHFKQFAKFLKKV